MKMDKIINELYNLNANISALTHVRKYRFTLDDQMSLNLKLADIIKRLRELNDE